MSAPKPDYWTKRNVDWTDLTVLGIGMILVGFKVDSRPLIEIGGVFTGWGGLTILRIYVVKAWRAAKRKGNGP